MKKITINNKEYTLEYTIGASLYDDCVTSVMQMLGSLAMADNAENARESILEQIAIMGGVPKTTMTVFYAGLLEHHGTGEYAGEDSDETITSMSDARKLIAEYLKEHNETGDGSFMDIFNLCLACMGDDDFLKLIGVDKMIEGNIPTKTTKKKVGRPKKETTEAQ